MKTLICPLCGVYTSFNPALVNLPEHMSYEPSSIPAVVSPVPVFVLGHHVPPRKGLDNYAIVVCQGCGELFIATNKGMEGWVAVHPIPHKMLPIEVPEPIKSEFEEASLCLAIDAYKACMLMCEIALEHLWNQQGVSGLDDLKDKGIISNRLYNRANEIRLWGNLIKHKLLDSSISKDESNQVIGFLELLLHEVYIEPAHLDALTKKRENLKKK
ncbi:MAG: DUF4145 domain-containing protein [Dehalococcoidales bacterium]